MIKHLFLSPVFARPDADAIGGSRQSGDDRRAAIALAARALIADKGFEGLRMRDIADSVGINIATLHYHVPSKEALISLVAESAKQEFIAQDQVNARKTMNSVQRLEQEIADFVDVLENRPQLWSVMSELAERARRDENAKKVNSEMRRGWCKKIEAIFDAGIADGSLRANIDPPSAAMLFVSALIGSSKMAPDRTEDRKRVLQELIRAFVAPPSSS